MFVSENSNENRHSQHISAKKNQRFLNETELGLEKRRFQGELKMAFQYLKGSYGKEGGKLFRRVCGDRAMGNGLKLNE